MRQTIGPLLRGPIHKEISFEVEINQEPRDINEAVYYAILYKLEISAEGKGHSAQTQNAHTKRTKGVSVPKYKMMGWEL